MDKITKKSCVPAIRFKGFTDTWEQRKFSDFTFPAGERNKDDLDLEPFAITNNQGFIAQSEAHDDFGYMKDVDRKMYIVVKPNSFAYNPARINVGSLGYYEGAENVIVSSLYEVFQTAEYVDDKFLKHWFKTKAFQDWIERLQEGSVRLYFYYDKLCECIMSMPSVEEQRKIGAYLDKIDNLITLHQRKLDKLHNVKKSLLEKMFPKNGADKPEIRFKGFTHAWEQRELRTAATFSKGSGYSKNDLKENGTPIILYGRLYTKYETVISEVDTFVDAQPNSVYSTGHEVIVPASGETAEDISRASFVAKSGILLGGDLNIIVPDDYINPVFLALTISNGNQQKELSKRAQGKSVVHIHNSDLENVVLLYPKYEEQEKIGEYFSKLDSLITLHQRKLEKLRQIKKSMLEKMFV
ncbi:MAG TPA: restriction endonuclease subunit S [Ruminococcus sp.]|nr:restriction endonuclease subunit S [Ruminococcus sp.]